MGRTTILFRFPESPGAMTGMCGLVRSAGSAECTDERLHAVY